jgi:hypothetical protein
VRCPPEIRHQRLGFAGEGTDRPPNHGCAKVSATPVGVSQSPAAVADVVTGEPAEQPTGADRHLASFSWPYAALMRARFGAMTSRSTSAASSRCSKRVNTALAT